jgi:hypothetical protein
MNLRTIVQRPARIAATAAAAVLLFLAGSAAGSESARFAVAQATTDRQVPSAADADTLWHYLATLPPAVRAQTIIAFNPKVSEALAAIVAGNIARATQ